MEENEEKDSLIQEAFNNGYLIAKYEPELAEKLSKIKAVSSYVIGIQKGREQYLSEQTKDKLPAWLTGNRPAKEKNDVDKTKDREPGR